MSIHVHNIIPNSEIMLFAGVPWDDSYTNTLRAQSSDGSDKKRDTMFDTWSRSKLYLEKCTPVRDGVVRVPYSADGIQFYSYMRFVNQNFSTRYIYAFIKEIRWVSWTVSEIVYEVDVIQTWFSTARLQPSYILRAHSNIDTIGYNLQPEPIDTGYMRTQRLAKTSYFSDSNREILAIYKPKNSIACGLYGGNITALQYKTFQYSSAGLDELSDFINTISEEGREDAIVSITIATRQFSPSRAATSPTTRPYSCVNTPRRYGRNGSYTPKNKKLLTYPYTYLKVYSPTTNPLNLRYELFTSLPGLEGQPSEYDCAFNIMGTYGANMELLLSPGNYTPAKTSDLRLELSGFPQFPWLTDSYKAWLAQTASRRSWTDTSAGINLGTGLIGGLLSLNAGKVADSAMTYVNTMAEQQIAKDEAGVNPTTVHGTSTTNASFLNHDMEFTFENIHMDIDYAMRADDFLTRFGYAQNKIDYPNLHARQNFTYMKISDLNVSGDMPNDVRAKLKEIFMNGITFWEDVNNVGNYKVDNLPLG